MTDSVFSVTVEQLRESTQTWEDEELQDYGEYMTFVAQKQAAEGNQAEAAHCELLAATCAEIIQERQAARQVAAEA